MTGQSAGLGAWCWLCPWLLPTVVWGWKGWRERVSSTSSQALKARDSLGQPAPGLMTVVCPEKAQAELLALSLF